MRRSHISFAVLALATLLALLGPSLAPPAATAQDGVFSDASRRPDASPAPPRAVVRERLVEVNFPMLDSAARAGVGSAVTLNLFNNDGTLFPPVTLTATRDRVERTSSGQGVIWSGKVSGDPASRVTLVAENGAMAGDILAGSRVYHVRSVGRGVHAIYELDPGAFPPDEHVLPGGVRLGSGSAGAARAAVAAAITGQAAATSPDAVSAPSGGAATPATATDDGLSVDLMVVYTSAAAAEVGGAAGMNAQVDLVGQFA